MKFSWFPVAIAIILAFLAGRFLGQIDNYNYKDTIAPVFKTLKKP